MAQPNQLGASEIYIPSSKETENAAQHPMEVDGIAISNSEGTKALSDGPSPMALDSEADPSIVNQAISATTPRVTAKAAAATNTEMLDAEEDDENRNGDNTAEPQDVESSSDDDRDWDEEEKEKQQHEPVESTDATAASARGADKGSSATSAKPPASQASWSLLLRLIPDTELRDSLERDYTLPFWQRRRATIKKKFRFAQEEVGLLMKYKAKLANAKHLASASLAIVAATAMIIGRNIENVRQKWSTLSVTPIVSDASAGTSSSAPPLRQPLINTLDSVAAIDQQIALVSERLVRHLKAIPTEIRYELEGRNSMLLQLLKASEEPRANEKTNGTSDKSNDPASGPVDAQPNSLKLSGALRGVLDVPRVIAEMRLIGHIQSRLRTAFEDELTRLTNTPSSSSSLSSSPLSTPSTAAAASATDGTEGKPVRTRVYIPDISYGRSPVVVPCVNEVDDEQPPTPSELSWTESNIAGPGVSLEADTSMVPGCSCVGKCQPMADGQGCTCLAEMGGRLPYDGTGRLTFDSVRDFGHPIYECNRNCACSANCPNRVVQHGSRASLVVFKTKEGKGWGVRAGAFVPRGTFVAQYTGEVITDEEAERRGKTYENAGLSYLYDLDVVGSARFVIDATYHGNISRFINHSCNPNLVNYQVWVDNVDPEKPLVAFFAKRDIQPGEELCFDYRYNNTKERKGKVNCLCGAPNCRKFLY